MLLQVTLPQRLRSKVHEKLFSKSVDPGVLITTKGAEDISIRFGFLQNKLVKNYKYKEACYRPFLLRRRK